MKKSRYSEEQIIAVLKEHQAGIPVLELCRRHGISEATICIYGRLSHCKPTLSWSAWPPLQTSIRRHPMSSARPNGESARASLNKW